MIIASINPTSVNWDNLVAEKIDGETGYADIKTQIFGAIKIREVEYSRNFLADHWCEKGHIVYVISGQLVLEHTDNTEHVINSGSLYVVGDNTMAHKAKSADGAKVLIVD